MAAARHEAVQRKIEQTKKRNAFSIFRFRDAYARQNNRVKVHIAVVLLCHVFLHGGKIAFEAWKKTDKLITFFNTSR